jgi:hypothetical protein
MDFRRANPIICREPNWESNLNNNDNRSKTDGVQGVVVVVDPNNGQVELPPLDQRLEGANPRVVVDPVGRVKVDKHSIPNDNE